MNMSPIKHNLLGLTFAFACTAPVILMAQPQTMEQKAAYTIGSNFIQSMKTQGVELDIDSVIQGIKDASSGAEMALSQDEMTQTLTAFKAQLTKQQEQAKQAIADKNKELGDEFLAQNKSKEGVVTLKSGLQYKVINSGTGPSPKASDKVTTHYRGTLIDGTEFDSSYSRNKPSSFPVKGVIPGWVESLQLRHVGDKWKLFIPSDLAYGSRGAGGVIPPNTTLIFDIELISIEK